MSNHRRRPRGGPTRTQLLAGELRGLPRLGRWATAGATCGGGIGSVVGLVVGLIVHPATAWFAAVELGLPAAIVGTALGTVGALIATAGRRIGRRL